MLAPPTYSDCDMATTQTSDFPRLRFARFIAEPFERGFGITVGNSIRRILLSSLEGASVTRVSITRSSSKRAGLR